jgi:hypothetical protein
LGFKVFGIEGINDLFHLLAAGLNLGDIRNLAPRVSSQSEIKIRIGYEDWVDADHTAPHFESG